MKYPERSIKAFNSWLKASDHSRASKIAGVMLHSTRSGIEGGDDGPRTEGWDSNPDNMARDQYGRPLYWGSYQDMILCEDGLRIICTNWDYEYATWTAGFGGAGTWAAGVNYIQIEIAQGTLTESFEDAQIDSLAEKTAELAHRYNFPIVRIPFLDQYGTPPRGICTHEASANGVKTGKSDPGPMFPWADFLAKAKNYYAPPQEEDEMTPEERELLHLVARAIAYTDPEFKGDYGQAQTYDDEVIQEIFRRLRTYHQHYGSVTGRQYALDGGGPYTP